MKVTFILLSIFSISFIKCTDLNSFEINRIEFTPLHDAIILNDIVDIFNEFENNLKPQFDTHVFSNSESDEDIENLLSEYQQHLDKAHEQRLNYIRKVKGKNKVPLLRHEKFNKLKPVARNSNRENNDYYFENIKHSTPLLNTIMPHNWNMKYLKKSDDLFDSSKSSYDVKEITNLPRLDFKGSPSEPMLSSCICKENVIPCKCQCKQCFFTEPVLSRNFNLISPFTNSILQTSKYADSKSNILDNNLNLRIKIDVQLPNISMLSNMLKYRNHDMTEEHEDAIPKETLSTINLPFPYLNFPIPVELIGYKQNTLRDKSSPLHKITIHKKKKFRVGSNNKKHKNKKLYTLHNFKFDPQIQENLTMGYNNNSAINNSLNNNEEKEVILKINNETIRNYTNNVTNTTPLYSNLSNQSSERIYLTINITKGNDTLYDNVTKIENSIETDLVSKKDNVSTTKLLRSKREIKNKVSKPFTLFNYNKTTTTLSPINSQSNSSHVINKDPELDIELLYWPLANKNKSLISSKNITALILDREIKKAKLNMTSDKIHSNHSTALEKAIFGDVDWNDIDSVVPMFMSFVGKYLTGVLTFCSQNVCHSMNCAKKICMHRICTPDNRYNNKGHCAGNNDTDSVATMESIMDLPSNIAFEVVDILEEKLLGKLFGKGTLCINSKCSAFAVSKKTFRKSKCIFKDLNVAGHCPNLKNDKIL